MNVQPAWSGRGHLGIVMVDRDHSDIETVFQCAHYLARNADGKLCIRAAPGQPKPLCLVRGGAERARLGEGPVNTEIQGLTLERASGGLSKRLSHVLFRVDALEQAFSSF